MLDAVEDDVGTSRMTLRNAMECSGQMLRHKAGPTTELGRTASLPDVKDLRLCSDAEIERRVARLNDALDGTCSALGVAADMWPITDRRENWG